MPSPLEPLKVSCVDSECSADLHCFRPTRDMSEAERGCCRECGADLVDWKTLHRRDFAQIDSLFTELAKELVRHHYWHMTIPPEILRKARCSRPDVLAGRVRAAIHSRVGPPSSELFRDGAQTPNEHSSDAQIYFLGMHAVAACCRKCMEYWHGIPREQRLTDEEEQYFASLVWAYVCLRTDSPHHAGLIAP